MMTYAVVIGALLWMCILMYQKVIKSIRRQLEFVANYTKDTSRRLEVWDKTEFGELEHELNEMLDKIEELNRNVLQEREGRIQLEYAKKQTEMIAYKNQINPHFMLNTLGCLRGMALYRGEKEIARLTEAMTRMFQYNVKGEERLCIVIEDDGVGMSDEERKYQQQKLAPVKNPGCRNVPEKEIGVANVARRVNLFYGEDYRLEFSGQEGGGTTVTMELPRELP